MTDKIISKASDIEVAVMLGGHIENPCTCESNGKVCDIRSFYIREAKRVLPTLTNPFARELLQESVDMYRS